MAAVIAFVSRQARQERASVDGHLDMLVSMQHEVLQAEQRLATLRRGLFAENLAFLERIIGGGVVNFFLRKMLRYPDPDYFRVGTGLVALLEMKANGDARLFQMLGAALLYVGHYIIDASREEREQIERRYLPAVG